MKCSSRRQSIRRSLEDVILKPVGRWNKWHRGQNLAAECSQKPKEWRKLATTDRTTCWAKVAWRERNFMKKVVEEQG
jgi:hypothetical protein